MKDRYGFFLSGPIGNVASQGAMIEVTTARYIGVNIDTAVLRNLKPEPLFENKETGVLWSVQF